MSPSALNPPDAPPAAPTIPEGLGTKLGKVGALILALATVVTPFLDGDQTGNTRLFAILTTVVLVATILGRMLQAAAVYFGGSDPLAALTPYATSPAAGADDDHIAATEGIIALGVDPKVLPDEGDSEAANREGTP